MVIDAILFDADGVVQTTSDDFRATLESVVGDPDRAEAFVADVFRVEGGALTGAVDFREELQEVLRRWDVAIAVDEVLRAWARIAPVPGVLELIADLRARQYPCFVASNQQPYRARHMSGTLGYADAFTGEFYSYALRARKPDPAFFEAILRELEVEPSALLFFDDHEPNVEAAAALGIRAQRFAAREHDDPAAVLRRLVEAELGAE